MAKQLNVSLAFQADTSQARAQIQGLINELNKISSIGTNSVNTEKLTSDILEAKMAAKDLGVMLEQSFNVDTGKLDLNRFNSSLKKSGLSLTDYGNKLATLGVQGDQAFLKVAQSIVETEAPLRRSSGLLKEFGTTLANTARWQISSSILHGFMGSVQKAYGYAQDLNESLNEIRIVTGQNIDQMAEFAEQANKAAKALNATTTEYTNASLIYYQQGLSDEEVQARTDITIKMANAAGQSAEIVSDQLTAVWNNFYDGSKSLEYYADVMTALGAATASSTDEIAGGLEKFAAIGDTIGLSYEYAAAALATITSNTRQSEEVVGTALKTIFARIQGLNLGETLDDGTTLNKYSEALQKVGISIFDQAGELKKMDDILDEMGDKWDTLSKAQQTALAQTVAGTRQYTQLIALMENWNSGDADSMMTNLETAYSSSGALQEQADIYAESWEASKDRVIAAAEGIYDSLIDEDFFIGLNDTLASALGVVEKLVDAMGGMPGILSLVGVLVTSIFKDQLTTGINNAIHNFENFTRVSHSEMKQLKKEAYEYAQEMIRGLTDTSPGFQRQSEHLTRVYELQQLTEEALKGVNAEQAEAIQAVYKQAKAYSEVAVEAGRAADEAQRLFEEQQKTARETLGAGAQKKIQDSADISVGLAGADLIREAKNVENMGTEMGGVGKSVSDLTIAIQEYKAALRTDDEDKIAAAAENLRNKMQGVSDAASMQTQAFTEYQKVVESAAQHITAFENNIQNFQNSLEDDTTTQEQAEEIEKYILEMQKLGYPVDAATSALKKYKEAIDSGDEGKKKAALDNLGITFKTLKISTEDSEKAIQKYGISLVKNHQNANKYRTILSKMGDKLKSITGITRTKVIATNNDKEATERAAQEQKNYAEILKKAQTSMQSFGSGASSAIQGVSSLGMALSSMKGVIDTLSDPDTSGFEKFLSILTSFGMIESSLTSGFSQISKGFKDMAEAADGSTISLLTQVAQMKTAELQEGSFIGKVKEGIAARKLEIATSQGTIASKLGEAGASEVAEETEEELNEEKQKNVKTTLGMVIAAMSDAVAKTGEAGATDLAATAQTALNTALTPFITLMGAVLTLLGSALVVMLPYIAGVTALAVVIGVVAQKMQEEEKGIENARNSLVLATEAYEKATEEANKFKEAVSNYDNAIDGLSNLTKGTNEYTEQVKKANEEAKKLIELYGLWDSVTMDGDLITFKPGVLEDIQEQYDTNVSKAEINKYLSDIILTKREKEELEKEVIKDLGTFSTGETNTIKRQGQIVKTGPEKKQLSSTQLDEVTEFLSQFSNLQNMDETSLKTAINNMIDAGEDVPKVIKNNITAISKNIEIFKDLIPTLNRFKNELDYKTQTVISSKINEKYGTEIERVSGNNLENYNVIQATISKAFVQAEQEKQNGLLNELDTVAKEAEEVTSNNDLEKWIKEKTGASERQEITDEEVAREYARVVLGFTDDQVNDMIYKKGSGGKGILTDVSEETTYVNAISDVDMRKKIAEYYGKQSVMDTYDLSSLNINGVDANTYVNSLMKIAEGGNKLGQEFGGNFTAALMQSIQEGKDIINLNSVFGNLNQDEVNALSNLTPQELMNKLGITEENLRAAGYQSAEEFEAAFDQGLASWNPETAKANFQSQVNSLLDTDVTTYDLDSDQAYEVAAGFIEMAEAGKDGYNMLNENAKAAKDATIRYLRLNNAVLDLSDNYDDYENVLNAVRGEQTKEGKALAVGTEAGKKLKKSLSDLLGVTEDFIDADLLEAIDPKDFAAAAKGDEAAIEKIRDAFIKLQAEENGIDFSGLKSELSSLKEGVVIDISADTMPLLYELITAKIAAGAGVTEIQELLSGLNIDADVTEFIGTMEEMKSASKDAATEVIANTSFSQDVETVTGENVTTHEEAGFETSYNEVGTKEITASVLQEDANGDLIEVTESYPIVNKTVTPTKTTEQTTDEVSGIEVQTENAAGDKVPVKGVQISNAHRSIGSSVSSGTKNAAASNNSGGGRGSSKPKKADRKKKTDVVDRYKEIEDQLDDIRNAQDKASKSADRLYGVDRIKQMQKVNQTLEKEVDLLKEKKKEAENYLKFDKAELNKVANENSVSFSYDENGNITNYTQQMEKLWKEYESVVDKANADGNADEDEQEAIEKAQKKYEAVKEAMDQYEETRELIEDLDSEIMDKIYEWQDNNFEQMNYKFELKIEISENSLQWIDYQLGKIEDDFYKSAEAAALFFNTLDQENTKYGQALNQMTITQEQFAEAEKLYNTFDEDGNRMISQANYIEAMKTARDASYEQLSMLQEVDEAMMNYYGDTLDKAMEELAKYTDQMDHLNGVMDHYNSLMSIMGKEKDYKSMGIILKGQAKLAEDRLAVAEASFNMLTREKNTAYDKWQQALKDKNAEAAELYEKEYRAALEKANEAEEEFLSSAEETLEAWKAELENSLEELGSNLEKALTGGKSFNWITTTMERMNSLHEEYLTTTNKIYETNKMMRTAQQEIDKSSNSAAKRRLKQFVEETKELQDQTTLSKFELDIQQAKYDLLLAEIALEEAQNAKSQVRLQRDSEGNFGYVYTADTSAIDDAQQKYEDAQNNLYNISLEGANKYAEQRQALMQEMYDSMRELQTQYLEGEFASEAEYNSALDELKIYYYEKLRQASELYNVAISADSDAAAENILGDSHLVASGVLGDFDTIARQWQNTLLTQMDDTTSSWVGKVEKYLENVEGYFTKWDKHCQQIAEKTHLNDLAAEVKDITDESKALVNEVTKTDGVLDTLDDELESVKNVTEAYANQRAEVQGLIKDIEDYIKKLDEKQKAESGIDEESVQLTPELTPSTKTSLGSIEKTANEIATAAKTIVEKVHQGQLGSRESGWIPSARAAGYEEEAIQLALKAFNESKSGAGYSYYYNKALELLDSYDTGGYTGDWDGSYGKLAMLHKKELVLKEGDTANFLASMEVLERILKVIDLQSVNAQYTANLNSPTFGKLQQETLEQNVHIEANFPNATDRNEIEEAFKDIVNLASQYANRK